ncbi:MAG: hypothetical protein IT372_10160 [Polyangiaceae bacterium]|nr:hypothetical protein [Polyangiaceae bacterium]
MDAAPQALGACECTAGRIDLAGIPLRPSSAAEASVALDMVTARLRRRSDPRAAFSEVYAIITRRVAELVAAGPGVFLEPAWISRLAGRFCARYLEALSACAEGRPDCGAWAEASRYAERRATVPAQEAVLGLSAHINYDLAIGIFDNIVELGGRDDARLLARYRHDHDAVNAILRAALPEAFERLIRDQRCPVSAFVDRWARPVARWAIMGFLVRWRARVWREVLALLSARGQGERDEAIRRMDRRATRLGRLFTAPSAAFVKLRSVVGGRAQAAPPAVRMRRDVPPRAIGDSARP